MSTADERAEKAEADLQRLREGLEAFITAQRYWDRPQDIHAALRALLDEGERG